MHNENMTIRPALAANTTRMEEQLQLHDWKGGWEGETPEYLFAGFHKKVEEVKDGLNYLNVTPGDSAIDMVIEDITHAQNYLMMLADNLIRSKQG